MLFVGDDWAEDHHDVEVQDEQGKTLKKARLPEGMEGMTRLHELIARFLPDRSDPGQVLVGIETDPGPWVRALIAAGYQVFGVNPKTAARHRELTHCRAPRTTRPTPAPWPTCCAPVATSYAR